MFGGVADPDFVEAMLLEQYQAQISSALTPAFAADSSPELAAEAINVCATFISTGIVTDVDRMGRILKLLVSALESFSGKQCHLSMCLAADRLSAIRDSFDRRFEWSNIKCSSHGSYVSLLCMGRAADRDARAQVPRGSCQTSSSKTHTAVALLSARVRSASVRARHLRQCKHRGAGS